MPAKGPGFPCPSCGSTAADVKDSRMAQRAGIDVRWRRRWCTGCGHRWTTLELPELVAKRMFAVAEAAAEYHDAADFLRRLK